MFVDLIKLEKNSQIPVYSQITTQLIDLIQSGVLQAGTKLPGSRIVSQLLGVHRNTLTTALDELISQGWLETIPGKGTYVKQDIEPTKAIDLPETEAEHNKAPALQFPTVLKRKVMVVSEQYHLDDGLPDPRLAPLKELQRAYKTSLMEGNLYPKFTYAETKGNLHLRQVLADYLRQTRGLKLNENNLLITRGVTQALYLCIQAFIKRGDKVAVGELNWESANASFSYHGAELIKIKVDESGLDTEHLEEILQQQRIKMLYLTPHHQYPTTVIMPAHRRLKLIQLARKYEFYVFEDDYDFDFHYQMQPIMPLASAAHGNFVMYTGSFTKAISPVFRVGYLVGSEEQVEYLSGIRRMVDRQGDGLLELAIAELLDLGILQRYLRKNKRIYEQRRDVFSQLLEENLADYLHFEKPQGGMSVWAKFNLDIDLNLVSERAKKRGLYVQPATEFPNLNATRLGFASSTFEELETALRKLKSCL